VASLILICWHILHSCWLRIYTGHHEPQYRRLAQVPKALFLVCHFPPTSNYQAGKPQQLNPALWLLTRALLWLQPSAGHKHGGQEWPGMEVIRQMCIKGKHGLRSLIGKWKWKRHPACCGSEQRLRTLAAMRKKYSVGFTFLCVFGSLCLLILYSWMQPTSDGTYLRKKLYETCTDFFLSLPPSNTDNFLHRIYFIVSIINTLEMIYV
jgi:hypothetical protein